MRCRDRLLVIALALLAPAAAYAQGMGSGAGVPDVAMVYPRGGATSPSLDYIFSAGSYYQNGTPACVSASTCLTTTRASVGTAVDASGNWSSFANNIARTTNVGLTVEEARTNSTRNNTMAGFVAGTPGTLPTNWSVSVPAALTTNVIGSGTESGINYVDLQVVGTPDASGGWFLEFDTPATPASQNQVWTGSFFIRLVGGSLTNISGTLSVVQSLTAGSVFLSQGAFTCSAPTAAALTSQRCAESYTLPDATAGAANLLVGFLTSTGQPVNVTLRIGWPQLELGAFATTPIPTTNATVTRAADVVTVTTVPSFGNSYSTFVSGSPESPTTNTVNQAVFSLDDGTANNRLSALRAATTNVYTETFVIASVAQAGSASVTLWNPATTQKIAVSRTAGLQPMVINGVLQTTNNISPILAGATISAIHIGSRYDGTIQFNGVLSRFSIWPTVALTTAQLQALTK